MMLVELTTTPSESLPVTEFRAHLRLGSGFAEDTLQDAVLENLLRASVAAIEGRTGKALFARQFVWTLTAWRDREAQVLPLAPVRELVSLKLIARSGAETVLDPAAYRLVQDMHRPALRPTSLVLPAVPTGGTAEIQFEAGYGPDWGDIPSDLGHAVLLLAAHYYEHRHDATSEAMGAIPFGVAALLERYRARRIGGGL